MTTSPSNATPTDRLGRPIRDLRISVTDRCNFRCRYCMPREMFGEGFEFLPRTQILTYEEIARTATLFHHLGTRKLRLTGGEPLLRRDLPVLIEKLARLEDVEIALTSNGSLLAERAAELAEAGLDRVTVSLDSLDEDVFRRMNDVDFPVSRVLDGIAAAQRAGLAPVKVNAVVHRGVNDHTVIDLARHFHGTGVILRLIEYMDVGSSNGWRMEEVVPTADLVATIGAELPLAPLEPRYPGEVARRYRYTDGGGEIGFVTSVTQPFCGDCTRARLSAEGTLYTCLFATTGTDLREALRSGADDDELLALLAGVWRRREDRYSELRGAHTPKLPTLPKVEMSYIGG